MDAADIALIAIGVLGAIAIVWAGFLLDRRSQRTKSAKWMRAWTILTRVRNELFSRLHGPLRLQDQRAEAAPKKRKRKPATPRRKASRKPTR
ncbi:MAG: hypothetical protein ABIR08_12035 [Sphingomonas sp.]